MKWFKHETDARNSLKLRKVRRKYGADGYAIYWFCLEAIAYEVDKDNLTFDLKEDAETIAFELSIQEKRVEEIMHYLVKAELFESSKGVVTCLKLAERLDKSMTNSPKMRNWLDTKSVMTSADKVMTDADQVKTCVELEVDKTREEVEQPKHLDQSKIDRGNVITEAFNYFWSNMKLSKKAKPASIKAFSKSVLKINDPLHFAKYLVTDTVTRFDNKQMGFDTLHPATYLNGQRWEDDYTIDAKEKKAPTSASGDGSDWRRFENEIY